MVLGVEIRKDQESKTVESAKSSAVFNAGLIIMWLIQSDSEYSQLLDLMALEYSIWKSPSQKRTRSFCHSLPLSLAQPGEQFGSANLHGPYVLQYNMQYHIIL